MPDNEPVAHDPDRRLDHGAYVPLTVMYPDAAIPVLQISMPTLDPQRLLHLGERLRPLRDERRPDHRVRIHHARSAVPRRRVARTPARSDWSDRVRRLGAANASPRGDVDALIDFRHQAPGMPYAHPTIEHFSPLFVALWASQRSGAIAQTGHRRLLDGPGETVHRTDLTGYTVEASRQVVTHAETASNSCWRPAQPTSGETGTPPTRRSSGAAEADAAGHRRPRRDVRGGVATAGPRQESLRVDGARSHSWLGTDPPSAAMKAVRTSALAWINSRGPQHRLQG